MNFDNVYMFIDVYGWMLIQVRYLITW